MTANEGRRRGGVSFLSYCIWFTFFSFEQGNYFFIDDGPLFESMEHVIDYYSRMQDGLPTVLQSPVPPRPKPPLPEFPRHGVCQNPKKSGNKFIKCIKVTTVMDVWLVSAQHTQIK